MSKRITSLYIVVMYGIGIILTYTGFFHYIVGIPFETTHGMEYTNGTTLTLSVGFTLFFMLNLLRKE